MNSTRKTQGGLSGKVTFLVGVAGCNDFWCRPKAWMGGSSMKNQEENFPGGANRKWKFFEGQKEGLEWLENGWVVWGCGKWWSWRSGHIPQDPVGHCEELGFYLLVKGSPWRVRSLEAQQIDFCSILMKNSNPHNITLSKSHSLDSQKTSSEMDWTKWNLCYFLSLSTDSNFK